MSRGILRRISESGSAPARAVVAASAAYAVVLSAACLGKFTSFGYDDFDLAVHSQSVWNIIHGSLDCSILGIPFPGNHMALILFAIAPLYALWPSPLLLLYLQAVVLAAGSWAVYLLAKKEIGSRWAAVFGTAYLLYPPLVFMNLYEFHPVALASAFLAFALYFYRTNQFGRFLSVLALAIACQENIALIAIGFGICALLQRKPFRWFAVPVAGAGIYLIAVIGFIMPRMNQGVIQFHRLYQHLGNSLPEIALNVLSHPLRSLEIMLHPVKLNFLNLLLAPVGYMSLVSPSLLVPVLPVLLQRLLSDRTTEFTLVFHYQAEFIPFVFASAVTGFKRLVNLRWRPVRCGARFALILFPLGAIAATGVPGILFTNISGLFEESAGTKTRREIVNSVPAGAPTAASFEFLPRLVSRRNLYSLHHVVSGFHTLSDVPYPVPDNVKYVILNTHDRLTFLTGNFYRRDSYRRIRRLLSGGAWSVVTNIETLVALKRGETIHNSVERLCEETEYMPSAAGTNITTVPPHAPIRAAGYYLGPPGPDMTAPLTLFWKKVKQDDGDYDALVTVTSGEVLYIGFLAPGSRIRPPQSWPEKTLMADRHRIRLSSEPAGKTRLTCRLRKIPE
ncbi:MAG: DUF2079 domain-containing protein [Kiritimatiellia bacterium]